MNRAMLDKLRRSIEATAPTALPRLSEHFVDTDGSRKIRIYGRVIGGKQMVIILPELRPLDVPEASRVVEEP